MERERIIQELERLAPPELSEDFDTGRIGLVVEGTDDITRVCAALDATTGVVAQATAAGAQLLVVHHTPLWNPVTKIQGRLAQILKTALSRDLNIYVMHTNFDRAPGGVNDCLADILGLTDRVTMSLGIVGSCDLTPGRIRELTDAPVRVTGLCREIHRLAVVGGSGFDQALISEAAGLGADAFLSSELKHSTALVSEIPCLESTHYALEAPAMKQLALRMGWQYIDDPPGVWTVP